MNERKLEIFLAIVVSFGAVMMQEAAIRQNNSELLIGVVIIAIGSPGFIFLEYRKHKRIPKEIRPRLKEVEGKWWTHSESHYNLPWWFTLLQGIFAVGQFVLIRDYMIFLVPVYLAVTYLIYRFGQTKFQFTLWMAIFLFYTSLLATPFCVASLRQPESLSTVLGLDAITSRRVTALLSIYTVSALVISSAMVVTHSRRLELLRRRKLDARSFQALIEKTLVGMQGSKNLDKVKASCLDIPLVVQLFSQGNWSSVVSFGWSVIDRSLNLLGKGKGTTEKAKTICICSDEFGRCKKARNDYVHGGHTPTMQNALDTLIVIQNLLGALI